MYYLEYDLPDGTKTLVQLHEDHYPEGARLRRFEGETAIASDVSLPDAFRPIVGFCAALTQQAGSRKAGVEITISIGFTNRGHAYVTPDRDSAAATVVSG